MTQPLLPAQPQPLLLEPTQAAHWYGVRGDFSRAPVHSGISNLTHKAPLSRSSPRTGHARNAQVSHAPVPGYMLFWSTHPGLPLAQWTQSRAHPGQAFSSLHHRHDSTSANGVSTSLHVQIAEVISCFPWKPGTRPSCWINVTWLGA